MLQSRNLDDQTYEEILKAALGRLPWLCPNWTDHNAHDPGVTLLELFAWYKEMQQFHMNQCGDAMVRTLLKLCGVKQTPAQASTCCVLADGTARRALSRMQTPEGLEFELLEPIPVQVPELKTGVIEAEGQYFDVTDFIAQPLIALYPFEYGGRADTTLWLGFAQAPAAEFRLWFQIDEPAGAVARNPFSSPEQSAGTLAWTAPPGVELEVLSDQTHGLAVSGFITYRYRGTWPMEPLSDFEAACWLRVQRVERSCEDRVRVAAISTRRFLASQQMTLSRRHSFVMQGERFQTLLQDSLAMEAVFMAFVRHAEGWVQCTAFEQQTLEAGRQITVTDSLAVQDGADNLWIVCTDPLWYTQLLLASDGLPDMTLPLNLDSRQILEDRFELICDTVYADGKVRPALWHQTDSFQTAGPRDRVFVYDPIRRTITFGNGQHGAVVPRGQGAILGANLVVSACEGGNIPANSTLTDSDGTVCEHTQAEGGRSKETVRAAAQRFLLELEHTGRCATAADYEAAALATPGLRVAAAKALPGYDPQEPSGTSRRPVVTLVVVPWSDRPCAMPDAAFLKRVQAHVEQRRPVCTQIKVMAPQYVRLAVSLRLSNRTEEVIRHLEQVLQAYFRLDRDGSQIGGVLHSVDLTGQMQGIPGIGRIEGLTLRALNTNCYQTQSGDLELPKNGIPVLERLELREL